jgi:hypothetical protein
VASALDIDGLGELDDGEPPVRRVRDPVDAHLVAGQLRHQVGNERDVPGLVVVLVAPRPDA